MAEATQSFKRHARWLPAFHFFVIPVLLINLINTIRYFIVDWTLHDAFQVVLAAALLTLGFLARTQALAVQDRVIRLEMRLRLRGLLPPDMHSSIDTLTARQMVALRFASDAELVDLVREVLAGRLATSKDIKIRIKEWQSDWQRA